MTFLETPLQIVWFVLLLFFGIFWLILPLIILNRFRSVIKHLASIEEHLRFMRYNDEKARRESATQKEIEDFRSRT